MGLRVPIGANTESTLATPVLKQMILTLGALKTDIYTQLTATNTQPPSYFPM